MENRLELREQIKERKAKYCRLLDTKRFDEWETLFKPDVKVTFYNPDDTVLAQFQSMAEFAPVTREFIAANMTVHQVHLPEIEFKSDNLAFTIWPMEDWHVYAPQDGQQSKTLNGYGFYYETWERIDDEWLIASLELRRTVVRHQ